MSIVSHAAAAGNAADIRPIGIEAYFDKIRFWPRQPLSDRKLAALERTNGGGLYVLPIPAGFDPRLRQWLQLHQPHREALRLLTTFGEYHLNYGELALDWIYADEKRKDEDKHWADLHLIRRYHRGEQEIIFVEGETRYDARRRSPNLTALYGDRASKITGELYCLHLEWRCNRANALRSLGIHSVNDLVDFDYRAFWRKRLLLCEWTCHPRVLGRLCRACAELGDRAPLRGRKEWIDCVGGYRYSIDIAIGAAIQNIRVQTALDHYRKFNVGRYLKPLNVDHLLPPPFAPLSLF